MPMELVTDSQLERYMSAYGIVSFADHNEDGISDTDVLPDCKTYGNGLLTGWLSQRYEYSALTTAAIIPEIAAVLVLRELCLRRGNAPPASLEARYQELVVSGGQLDRIAAGKIPLVDSSGNRVAQKGGYAPAHSNLQVDRRYPETPIRVVDGSSNMEPTKLKRFVDRWRSEL